VNALVGLLIAFVDGTGQGVVAVAKGQGALTVSAQVIASAEESIVAVVVGGAFIV
jgi:hypothetical protein